MTKILGLFLLFLFTSCSTHEIASLRLETVSEIDIRPGNVTATKRGRIFSTVHPLHGSTGFQLIEISGNGYKAWPAEKYQSTPQTLDSNKMDTPLGITKSQDHSLWVVDIGLNRGRTAIWGFDIKRQELIKKVFLPMTLAPKGSFVQDLAVDKNKGWAYLADIAKPSLLTVNLKTGKGFRFTDHPSLNAEGKAVMIIDEVKTQFNGAPAKVGVNPVVLGPKGEFLYYGAMTGTRWYKVSTSALRSNNRQKIISSIKLVGRKPVSDGATMDQYGNHYFTDLNNNGISILTSKGELRPLVQSPLLDWPDNVQFGGSDSLYVAVNQLHKTPPFTGKGDLGIPPYRIMRIKLSR